MQHLRCDLPLAWRSPLLSWRSGKPAWRSEAVPLRSSPTPNEHLLPGQMAGGFQPAVSRPQAVVFRFYSIKSLQLFFSCRKMPPCLQKRTTPVKETLTFYILYFFSSGFLQMEKDSSGIASVCYGIEKKQCL
ncbi:hypothetical protein [Alkalicoccus urumqiensis]|uniref:hypothetical protein n=1 Tax=Alkalicoccus urumqiensis TaxID=1548213 RepID=UPI0015E61D26|nr:hypothetical protein [Alkalicoccus urumqiensis]